MVGILQRIMVPALTPHITVLGVYRVPVDQEEFRAELAVTLFPANDYSDTGDEARCYLARCVPVVLIEVFVEHTDARFDCGDFGQRTIGLLTADGEDNWQVAYDEALLSDDGTTVIRRSINGANQIARGRIAFYLRFYDPARPVRWSYGEFTCPPVQDISPALWTLVPYNPI